MCTRKVAWRKPPKRSPFPESRSSDTFSSPGQLTQSSPRRQPRCWSSASDYCGRMICWGRIKLLIGKEKRSFLWFVVCLLGSYWHSGCVFVGVYWHGYCVFIVVIEITTAITLYLTLFLLLLLLLLCYYSITVRQLESLVRLSEALARLHLDEHVSAYFRPALTYI